MTPAGVEAARRLVHLGEWGDRALEAARASLERGEHHARVFCVLMRSIRRIHEATKDACGVADPHALLFALRVTGDSITEAQRIWLQYGKEAGTA